MVKSHLLPFKPIFSYKFHAAAAHLQVMFTVLPIRTIFDVMSGIYGGACLCKNSQYVETLFEAVFTEELHHEYLTGISMLFCPITYESLKKV